MQNPKNLLVSARALQLAADTYRLTRLFPADERFGLMAQMRRAAVSIGSNIAEGCGRSSDKELVAFLHIALGSASELRFQIDVAKTLDFVNAEQASPSEDLVNEVMRMLSRLIVAVKARSKRPRDRS
jgi:four helix bundle protein